MQLTFFGLFLFAYFLSFSHTINQKTNGVDCVRNAIETRAVILGEYIIENDATVRATAKKFSISKSTVHKDVTERLKSDNPALWRQVKVVLERNKSERHIRGGLATRRKYKGEI